MAIKPISSYAPFPKLVVFIGFVITHIFFFTLAGMLVGASIWGNQFIKDINLLNDLSDPTVVAYLKLTQVFGQVGMLMGALLFVKLAYVNINGYIGSNRLPKIQSLLVASLLIFISLPVLNYLSALNELVKLPVSFRNFELWFQQQELANNKLLEAFLNVQSLWGLVLNVLIIALFTAIVEEIVFRGVLQNLGYEIFKNKHVAVAFTALTFAMIHFQFYKLIPMLLLAFMLGYLYLWSGSIWLSILVHFINNAATIIVLYYTNLGQASNLFEELGTRPQDVIAVIVSAITLILSMYFIYKTEIKSTTLES